MCAPQFSRPTGFCSVLVATLFAAFVSEAATITIVNLDGAGEGFNDPTPVAAVGGNMGTTIGQQRLNVFQRAADIWGAKVSSSVPIRVGASFDSLFCTANSATLGSAGAVAVFADFAGAPVTNTWYPSALANALAGMDLDPGTDDIRAQFNSNIGTPGCLSSLSWYYGLDGNPPSGTLELLNTVMHEVAHGLGFQTFIDVSTGAKFYGFDDTYMLNLEDHSTGKTYPIMTDGERATANTNTGNLHWIGTNVVANGGFLNSGRGVSNHVEMYAPDPVAPGSSVSHFSTSLSPDQLMEPFATALSDRTLTSFLMRDLGWVVISNAPPTGVADIVSRGKFTAMRIPIASLVTNDFDAELDPITLVGINLLTTNNVTLTTNATTIFYTNSPNVNDKFTYTISDGHGGTNTGEVLIQIAQSVSTATTVQLQVGVPGANTNTITLAGIPFYQYVVQFSTNVSTGPWNNLSTNTAGANGLWTVTDPTATNAQRFYRTVVP